MLVQIQVFIHGQVQGVGFRATVKRYADELHLQGFTRNLPDGTVEILAQGKNEDLDKLLEALRSDFGPRYIQKIDVHFRDPLPNLTDFQII
jgi:acylphosphatase